MNKDLILFGIQGAGKGTQAKLLLERKLNCHKSFEPGNIFRGLTSNDNAIGSALKAIMNSGNLIDNTVLYKLFEIFVSLVKTEEYIIGDGFPRTLQQMYYYFNQMDVLKRDFIWVYYDLPKDIAIERIMKRAQEQGRLDDTPESIAKRLELYEKETFPVIEYMEKMGKIIRIDANQDVESIYNDTCAALGL